VDRTRRAIETTAAGLLSVVVNDQEAARLLDLRQASAGIGALSDQPDGRALAWLRLLDRLCLWLRRHVRRWLDLPLTTLELTQPR